MKINKILKTLSFTTFILLINSCDVNDNPTIVLDDIITLEVLDATGTNINEAVGDGETIISLRATIPADADNRFRTVTFKKSNGEFLTIDSNAQIVADHLGIANVDVKVPLDDNILRFSAEIGENDEIYRTEADINLIGVDQVLDFVLLNGQSNPITEPIKADGVSLIQLQATVNHNQDVLNQVKFVNSGMGGFIGINASEGVKTINTSNIASIDFEVSNTVGRIFFTASTVGSSNISQELFIDLIPAKADNIIIEPQAVTMGLNTTNTITTYLTRTTGHVSQETPAQFKAFQLDVNTGEVVVGRFTGLQNTETDANGRIVVNFVSDTGDIDTTKPVFIRATTMNDQNIPVEEVISITVM